MQLSLIMCLLLLRENILLKDTIVGFPGSDNHLLICFIQTTRINSKAHSVSGAQRREGEGEVSQPPTCKSPPPSTSPYGPSCPKALGDDLPQARASAGGRRNYCSIPNHHKHSCGQLLPDPLSRGNDPTTQGSLFKKQKTPQPHLNEKKKNSDLQYCVF